MMQTTLYIVIFCISLTHGNIHRAIPGTPVSSKLLRVMNNEFNDNIILDDEDDENENFLIRVYKKASIVWVYSIPAAILVGSTGILPLLVFRVEHGKNLKDAISSNYLKLLLSFAVGGLLGDVFLHLLPEAWVHVNNDGHDHSASFTIGLWVLLGLLCFLTIEKIFLEEERLKEEEENLEKRLEAEMLDSEIESKADESLAQIRKRRPHEECQNANSEKSYSISNGNLNHANGSVPKSEANKHSGNSAIEDKVIEEDDRSQHIKVVGYLNLLANCIDNFTHGLAVAGSFTVSIPVGICTTFAILLHEIPHEIGDFAILLQAGFNRWEAAKGQLLTASGALFGCLFGLLAEGAGDASAWVLPFTSGGFLYIALVTIVPDLLKEEDFRESIKQIICLVSGVSIMGLVTLIHHDPA